MRVFDRYAQYYDLLYRDKDYAGEAAYLHGLIQRYAPQARSILELGCGTGAHALLLASKGFALHGADLSPHMVAIANQRREALPPEQQAGLRFVEGDLRSLRTDERYDVVVSLFHVISYQTTDQDLAAAFETARTHLQPGGLFVFDCWYGPAVLTDRPAVRVKRMEDAAVAVTRLAEPVMHPNDNRVDVHYQIFIQDKADGSRHELAETHRMRYLFKPEVVSLLGAHGMSLLGHEEWLTGNSPGFETWGTCFVARHDA